MLSIVPNHCKKFKPTVPEGLPPTLQMLFEPEMLSANFGDLLNWCDCLFSAVVVSPEEAKEVKIATRQQAHSISWFEYRAGRITASASRHHHWLEPFATQGHTNSQHQQCDGAAHMIKKLLPNTQKAWALAMSILSSVIVAL